MYFLKFFEAEYQSQNKKKQVFQHFSVILVLWIRLLLGLESLGVLSQVVLQASLFANRVFVF